MGREQEIGLLRERWEQVKDGVGQVVLLSGEGGIGKSRLVQVLMEHVAAEPQAWLTPCQCSPYYQNTALYPMIDVLERVVLHFERDETPPQKLRKLEGFLVQHGLELFYLWAMRQAIFSQAGRARAVSPGTRPVAPPETAVGAAVSPRDRAGGAGPPVPSLPSVGRGEGRVHRLMRALLTGARPRMLLDQGALGTEGDEMGALAAFWM